MALGVRCGSHPIVSFQLQKAHNGTSRAPSTWLFWQPKKKDGTTCRTSQTLTNGELKETSIGFLQMVTKNITIVEHFIKFNKKNDTKEYSMLFLTTRNSSKFGQQLVPPAFCPANSNLPSFKFQTNPGKSQLKQQMWIG